MPTYTFSCGTCGAVVDVVRRMREAGAELRCGCGAVMVREYRPAQVVRETYARPVRYASLSHPEGDGWGVPVAQDRGETKRLLRAHDKRHGTKLVY